METNYVIELGGSYIAIYKKNSGLILKEPSLLAVSKENDNYQVRAFGENAKILASIEDPTINIFSPFNSGKIKSQEYAEILLQLLLKKSGAKKGLSKIKANIIVSTGFTLEEKVELEKLFKAVGIHVDMYLPSVLGLALSDGKLSSKYMAVLDIGGSTSDMAVFNNQGIVSGGSIALGGRSMSAGVMNMITEKHNLEVSLFGAERVKEELASLASYDSSYMDIKGLDTSSNLERVVTMKAQDVRDVLTPYFHEILKQVEFILNSCSDEILRQIKVTGLLLGGQVSKTIGVERFFKEKLQIPVRVVDEIENAVIVGIGKNIKNKELLQKFSYK